MSEDLKSAIRTIAEYDGTLDAIVNSTFLEANYLRYSTSADALLPVWRKAFREMHGPEAGDSIWDSQFSEIVGLIIWEQIPSACLKLAQIISQLNEQK